MRDRLLSANYVTLCIIYLYTCSSLWSRVKHAGVSKAKNLLIPKKIKYMAGEKNKGRGKASKEKNKKKGDKDESKEKKTYAAGLF